jgi:DNA-binding beta-propeller fold protein YncE
MLMKNGWKLSWGKTAGVVACAAALLAMSGCTTTERRSGAASHVELNRVLSLPGVRGTRPDVGVPGRIDHLAYDPVTKRLFVAALENGSLEVLDLETGRRVRSIGGLSRPQGAAVVPTIGCVAVACGGDGVMHVYDTQSLEEKKTINVGPDADNVRYDVRNNQVLVSYGNTNKGAIAIFDPRTWTRVREIQFDSRPESFQIEPGGSRLFANLPKGVRAVTDGAVAVVNRDDGRILALIPLAGRARNFPMAYDAAHGRLFIASRRPARLIVIDTARNTVAAEAPCTDDSDDLFYDTVSGGVLVIAGGYRPDLQSSTNAPAIEAAIDVFEIGPDGKPEKVQTLPTAWRGRTGLFVPSRRALYVAVPFHGEHEAEIREYRVK